MRDGDEDAPAVEPEAGNALAPEDASTAPVEIDAEFADVETAEPQAPQHDPEVLEEAKKWGWKAPDEWRGEKPPGYIDDPERFLTAPGTLKRRFEAQQHEIEQLKQAHARGLVEQRRRMEAAREREVARIRDEQRKAVELGDTETWDRLEKEREKVAQPPREQPQPQGPDPVVSGYRQENEWAQSDVMWAAAIQAVDAGFRAGALPPDADTATQLAFAERSVREQYPHRFQAQPQRTPPMQRTDPGGTAPRQKSDWSKIDSETRADLKAAIKDGIYKDEAAALKAYKAAFPEEFN